jgi:serine/threonine protein kinase
VGTKSYQAPEVLASTGSAYDGAQADGWSIGVVLFILLLGSPPFAQVGL